ncbi:MAG: GNAT family N-acetyltransferase [Candidatus Thermoplasmatota archaeon]
MLGPADPLTTPRLALRPFVPDDADAVFAYASQPGFFTFLDHVPLRIRSDYRPSDAESHLRELASLAAAGWPSWAIVPHGGEPVGAIRFHRASDGGPDPELGYGIDPRRWGEGLASEAASAVMAWAAGRTTKAVARVHPANEASRRVLERSGFRLVGPDGRGRLAFCWAPPNLNLAPASPEPS